MTLIHIYLAESRNIRSRSLAADRVVFPLRILLCCIPGGFGIDLGVRSTPVPLCVLDFEFWCVKEGLEGKSTTEDMHAVTRQEKGKL
jgi:hypothetical protein